ncbi:MAG: S41 family peptidase [Thermogutta sp.]
MPRRNLQILVLAIIICLLCAYRSSRYTRVLTYALEQIQFKALEPRSPQQLTEGALRGMVGVLDPYSSYISEEDLPKFEEELDRQFAGIGVEIFLDPQSQRLCVASPLPNTPAQKAGIKPGDWIVAIDGQSTEGMTLEEAGKKMRGEPGTQVVLSVQTPGEEKPHEVKLTREIIRAETILGDTRNPDGTWNYVLQSHPEIGYVRISTFGEETTAQLKKIILDLKKKNIRGLILDLRDNPGGRLEEAIAMCDLFIESGVIVTTRYRNGQIKRQYTASGKPVCPDLPMSVLINHYSASASEIVAACLQDHGRATIVGERSFGKGTVQELIQLEAGLGMLKLTTAAYWRPSGKQIHRTVNAGEDQEWGVRPDPGKEVKLDRAEQDMLARYRALRDIYLPPGSPKPAGFDSIPADFRDRQLEVAVESILKGQETSAKSAE